MNDNAPGTAGTPPPRQFHTVDSLATLLRVDFQANGIDAVVEASEWNPEWHKGVPRVVVGYGRFTLGTPMGADQPGYGIPIPDGTGDVGRAVLDYLPRFRVWCHSLGVGDGPEAERARAATCELLLQTARAIREALGSPFREEPAGEWPKPWEMPVDYPAFAWGSFVAFEVLIPSPVIGGRLHVGTVVGVSVDDSVSTG